MADRDFTPVLFALNKNVVLLQAKIKFGASGAPTLDTSNFQSKGFCAVSQFSKSFTAAGTSSASITSVSDFTGLYNGMVLSGTNVAANSVISAINAGAGTFTVSNATTGAISAVTATGGYTLQFGSSSSKLDTYPVLLGFSALWDEVSLPGAVSTQASTPAGPEVFLMANQISVSGSASISFMTGTYNGAGATFKQVNPASGEALKLAFMLGNSTAG